MKKKSKLTSFFSIFLFIFLISIPLNILDVKAYTQSSITLPSNPMLENVNTRTMPLSNGRYVYVIGTHSVNNNLHVYIYSGSGSELAHSVLTINFGGTDHWIYDLSLYDNGTNILIFGVGKRLLTGNYASYPFVVTYNTLTYTSSTNIGVGLAHTVTVTTEISNTYEYNNIVYCMITIDASADYTRVIEFNLATEVKTYSYPTGYQNAIAFSGSIMGFQEENSDHAYLIAGKNGDTTRPTYWDWDLDSDTLDLLADHPTDTHWRIDSYISLRYIGGGLHTKDDTDVILYHTWAWCDDYAVLEIIQHRLEFDAGSIASGDLEGQNQRSIQISQTLHLPTEEVAFNGGYMVNGSIFKIFRVIQTAQYSGVFYTMRTELEVEDFEDFVETTLSITDNAEDISVVSTGIYNRCLRIFTSTMQTTEKSTDDIVYIFSGLPEGEREYNITVSYIPSGELYTSTQYSWNIVLRVNNQLRSGYAITLFIDENNQGTRLTDINGEVNFLVLQTISGYHTFDYDVYYSNVLEESFAESYVFNSLEGEEEGEGTLSIFVVGIFGLLPLLFIVLLPAFLLFTMLKTVLGFLIGLTLGGVLGLSVGILNISSFFLIALLIIAYVVIASKRG